MVASAHAVPAPRDRGPGAEPHQGGWPPAHAQVQVGAGPSGHTGARAWPLCCQLSCHLGGDGSPDRGPIFSPGHPLLPYSASCTPGQLLLEGETAGGGAGSGGSRVGLCSFTRPPSQIPPQTSHVGPAHQGMDPTSATPATSRGRRLACLERKLPRPGRRAPA